MSNQAERIRAFKLAQHARIQKQDEEEQWISSEELCTEGSSDEETHTCVKTSQRKPKRNMQKEKRGISPLAQSPKSVEPTSTYQTSQFLLPDINITNRIADTEASSSTDTLSSFVNKPSTTDVYAEQGIEISEAAKSCNLEEDEDDVYDDSEIEKMIQWRPKRGSIKLPEFDEGRTSSLNHTIFETNLFYEEMALNVNSLKRNIRRRKVENKTDDDKTINSFGDPSIKRIFHSVSKLDDKLSKMNTVLEMERSERQCVEKELCDTYSNTKSSFVNNKELQDFIELCKLENGEKSEQDDLSNKSIIEDTKKLSEMEDRPFVKRNIELAKKNSMSQLCLTDEEKLQLDSLLADLDSEEYNIDNDAEQKTSNVSVVEDSDCKPSQQNFNYFQLGDEEAATIENLDSKLNEVMQSYDEEGEENEALHKSLLSLDDENNTLESAEKQGKFWKHFQLKKRLETIDKNLESISLLDLEEQKKQEQNNSIEKNQVEDIKNNIDDT